MLGGDGLRARSLAPFDGFENDAVLRLRDPEPALRVAGRDVHGKRGAGRGEGEPRVDLDGAGEGIVAREADEEVVEAVVHFHVFGVGVDGEFLAA